MKDTPLIVHDFFDIRGGGERLILEMANGLSAEGMQPTLMYGWRSAESFGADHFPEHVIDAHYPKAWQSRGLRTLLLSWFFTRFRKRAQDFSIRIYSGICSVFVAPLRSGKSRNIFYCHTPPRFLYDQYDFHMQRSSLAKRIILTPVLAVYRLFYERCVGRMDLIIANSENIRKRIQKYLGRESVVVYPPCDASLFRWMGEGDYFLSTARHAPLKRVELIAEAFRRMPEKKLIIASSGENSEQVRAAAAGAPNIQFTGWTEENQMLSLIGNCLATVYIPIDEDFGMSPVESMAAGKPVIGVAEGGLLETVLEGETGFLAPARLTVENLMETVNKLTPETARGMRTACEKRAELFSATRFIAAMKKIIESN